MNVKYEPYLIMFFCIWGNETILGGIIVLKSKLLIVEDEMILADDMQLQLENMGYDVVGIASDGNDAIKLTKEKNPDLILMDIVLKGDMDGIDTSEKLNNLYNIPIVYLTAYFDDAILDRAKKTQPYGYIIKPFHEVQMHCAIVMALYKHQQELKNQSINGNK